MLLALELDSAHPFQDVALELGRHWYICQLTSWKSKFPVHNKEIDSRLSNRGDCIVRDIEKGVSN